MTKYGGFDLVVLRTTAQNARCGENSPKNGQNAVVGNCNTWFGVETV